ncbi:MAG: hypothetical protein JXM70_17170, partial [Pirellulales bacterium]|nr:hypothetical protein [Pirellulales bacterium]
MGNDMGTGDAERLEQAILDIAGGKNYRPLKPRQIAKRLNVPKDQMPQFKRVIKSMVSQGLLVYGPNHLLEASVLQTGAMDNSIKEKTENRTTEDIIKDKTTSKKEKKSKDKKAGKDVGKTAGKTAGKLKGNRLVGVFQRTERGFGFVRPRGVDGKRMAGQVADIYIPAKRSGDAATGDLVMVQLIKPRKQDKRFDRKRADNDLR